MTPSSGTPVAADCLESCMQECRDIYRHVSLTAETDWDYWTFSGQYSTVAELDFNELRFSLTGWVYFLIQYGVGFCFCLFFLKSIRMVLKPQGDRMTFQLSCSVCTRNVLL